MKQAGVIGEEETSTEKLSLPDWPVGKFVGAFSWLVIDVGGPTPGQVILGLSETSLASCGEQASKQCSSMVSALVPAFSSYFGLLS